MMRDLFKSVVGEIDRLLWGNKEVNKDIFRRWCQDFRFNEHEPSALIQDEGGPCAVITAVQASILRDILFNRKMKLSEIQECDQLDLLVNAFLDILTLVAVEQKDPTYYFFYWDRNNIENKNSDSSNEINIDHQTFIDGLNCAEATSLDELHGLVLSLASDFLLGRGCFAVLCLVYSVLATHGVETTRRGLADDQSVAGNGTVSMTPSADNIDEAECLIDQVHGHASHCLLSLLITGRATSHLFDGERDLAGYCMRGIMEQPKTGFLTIVESLAYCEVGWYLKNPSYPVWVLGSETHLTVLASPESGLVHREPRLADIHPSADGAVGRKAGLRQAELEFIRLGDGDDAGFISADKLAELLERLNMPHDTDSVLAIQRAVNPEELDVVLKEPFLRHVYADELARRDCPIREFALIHYNGLTRSNPGGEVRYLCGQARLLDPTEEITANPGADRNSPMQRCLGTKWPTISVVWATGTAPSLN